MLNISGLENGVVIDHIPAGVSMEIYNYLKLETVDDEVAIIKNAQSQKMGKKDIIKISGDVSNLDIDAVGFFYPDITVNLIKDGKIISKRKPGLPKKLVNIIRCKNPRCISSIEQELPQIFELTDAEHAIYRCQYCEEKYTK